MARFLKAAFWWSWRVPLLGSVPVNALLVAAAAAAGFVWAPVWLVALGLETTYLALLATHPRFQRLVKGLDLAKLDAAASDKRGELVASLDERAKARLRQLDLRTARIMDLSRAHGAEGYALDASAEALNKLSWVYLKLLVARQYLESREAATSEADLRRQVKALEGDLSQRDRLTETMRESKEATLKILQQRLDHLQRREATTKEIDSDLTRIEAQIELAVDEATIKGRPLAISPNIELATQLLDVGQFGASEAVVADLDRIYAQPAKAGRGKETPERA